MEFKNKADAARRVGISYLGGTDLSSKIVKGRKHGVMTYVMYLAPAEVSGYNVCPFSTEECRIGCLATSGRVIMESRSGQSKIVDARIKRTKLFFEEQQFFFDWMKSEIESAQRKAEREGYAFAIRLNGTSDIEWEQYRMYEGKTIFEVFSDVQFYDYTKHPLRAFNEIDNYQVTLSYTGKNKVAALRALSKGLNVAVIFNVKKGQKLPLTWNDYPVIDGDVTDYRPNDGSGVVVGLRFKEIADKDASELIKKSVFVEQ